MKYKNIEIIGHRGCAGLASENSKLAFDMALKCDLDWIETDIRMTADNVLVLWHNAFVKNKLMSSISYQELSAISNNKILPLESFIKTYKNKLNFNFDVKDPKTFTPLIDMIQKYNIQKDVLISSFNHSELLIAQEYDESLRYAPLIASRPANLPLFLSSFKNMDLVVLDYDFCDESLIKEFLKLNFELYLYNVHFVEQIDCLIDNGITSIIVDNPKTFI